MLDHRAIQAIIPHRYPLLLVDRVLALEPQRSIVATKCVSGTEACYAELSPSADPRDFAYPRSLIIESFGQAGALLWLASARLAAQPVEGVLMFAAARDCSFEADAFPGDTLEHHVTIDRILNDNVFLSGETRVAQQPVMRIGWALALVRPAHVLGFGDTALAAEGRP